jgi:hypothetical protein
MNKMKIESKENTTTDSIHVPKPDQKKEKPSFPFNFNINSEESIQTFVQPTHEEEPRENNLESIIPMFDNSDILFLQKPLSKETSEKKRVIISVDISEERAEKINNSKTLEPDKKMFKRKIRKKLKLNLNTFKKSIKEIPTIDRELQEITEDAER